MDRETKVDASVGAGRRENALEHGLTARLLLPRVLRPGRLDELKAQFRSEYTPTTVTGEIYILEAARHAAILEIIEEAEPAVMVQAAGALASFTGGEVLAADPAVQLAAAISAEPLERVARYRRSHERALHHALDKLSARRLPQVTPSQVSEIGGDSREPLFGTEEQCAKYLLRRFAAPGWRCPRCRHPGGHVVGLRQIWQCSRCHVQVGFRHNTVLENSRLPLRIWFAAIRAFAAKTAITPAELALAVGIQRLATAREMLCRMRAALHEEDVCERFAGLGALPSLAQAQL
jgi:hypothetical protein